MNAHKFLPVVLVAALLVTACGSNKKRTDADGGAQQLSGGYSDQMAPVSGGSSFDTTAANERALTTNIVYFDYDETSIKSESMSVVDTFASYLTANPTAKVRLEGHADERGTREYNVGLGERRAIAVQSALQAKGVSSEQLQLLSYGEERPAAAGHDESAWAQNRRVQLIRQ
ncbi:MAG TPA: peptidoglycan-associated lipoprotein Pal [Fontimonas sp.]